MVVYEPREDSFMIAENAIKLVKGKVLEVGVGSGYVSKEMAKVSVVESIIGIDINPNAINYSNTHNPDPKITYILSDLFENVKGKFDFIVCNPPYLPDDDFEDPALFGGKKGYEYIEKMIPQSLNHLNDDGKIILLFSNLTRKIEVDRIIEKNLLNKFLLEEKYIGGFETLYVYSIEKRKELITLNSLGVKNLEFFTKGKRGYIFTGIYNDTKVGIKVKNKVSQTDTMFNEARVLKIVNEQNIGPKLIYSDKDLVIYKFFEGLKIGDWIIDKEKQDIKKILLIVFDELRVLDIIKIDKKEMSHPHKHILVGEDNQVNSNASKQICLIDFERGRNDDYPSNVTGFCQFITSSSFGEVLISKGINIDKETIIKRAMDYKKEYTDESYKKILELI